MPCRVVAGVAVAAASDVPEKFPAGDEPVQAVAAVDGLHVHSCTIGVRDQVFAATEQVTDLSQAGEEARLAPATSKV